jgi:uncharacterized membrane protein
MTLLLIHIVAGLSAILAGAAALLVTKGGAVHRKAGLVFVAAMIVMGSMGAIIAATRLENPAQKFNIVAGLFVVYLVTTSLLTVRADARKHWMDGTALATAMGIAIFALGMAVFATPDPKFRWFPTVPATVFGTIALLAAIGDIRMLRAGGLRGKHRIARHLWRMCVALFIATGSFFAGQAKVFPPEYRSNVLMFAPMLLVLGAMCYWWARTLLSGRKARVTAAQPESTAAGPRIQAS